MAALIGLDTKQTMAYQIFTFLLAVLLIAIAFSFGCSIRFDAVRDLPQFATVGVKLSYRLLITNQTKQKQLGLRFIEEIDQTKINLANFRRFFQATPQKKQIRSLTMTYARWLKAIARQQKAKAKAIDLPILQPYSTTEVRGEITPTHRGVVRLAGMTILRPDPFNLFNAAKAIALPQSLLVLPPTLSATENQFTRNENVSVGKHQYGFFCRRLRGI